MKKLALLLVLLAGSFLTGCGVVDSGGDRMRRVGQINDIQARMAVDDWDYFWLYERDSRLTEWHSRVGY
ncbi:MAG TPA: hypothetical protein DCX07_12345 [Phycisphaerales bacterium]|nr:hypothetical protein [Phycisphaerales bacterium]